MCWFYSVNFSMLQQTLIWHHLHLSLLSDSDDRIPHVCWALMPFPKDVSWATTVIMFLGVVCGVYTALGLYFWIFEFSFRENGHGEYSEKGRLSCDFNTWTGRISKCRFLGDEWIKIEQRNHSWDYQSSVLNLSLPSRRLRSDTWGQGQECLKVRGGHINIKTERKARNVRKCSDSLREE